jgi:SAM-dependent methyltransferase
MRSWKNWLERLRIKLCGLSAAEKDRLRARLAARPYYQWFDAIYDEAHRAGAQTLFDPPIYQLIHQSLSRFLERSAVPRPGGTVIDFGCGEGANAIYLAKLGYRVTAVDISPIAIARARALAALEGVAIDFRLGDVVRLDDIADRVFDLGINVGTLHMLVKDEHRRQHVAEMGRVLRPGGVLFAFNNLARKDVRITDVDQYLYNCMARTEARCVLVDGSRREIVFQGVGFRSASLPQYRALFESAGFEVLETEVRQVTGGFWDRWRPGWRASRRFLALECRKL